MIFKTDVYPKINLENRMKLTAIIGSPRKNSNTEILVDKVIEGCKSQGEVEVNKIFIADKNINFCNGCLACMGVEPGKLICSIKDDMTEILEQMQNSDAFVFGTPNHMRTVSPLLLNFLCRMLPLLTFQAEYDAQGNRVAGEMSSLLKDKKAAMVISQGEKHFCSSLVYEVLINNLRDFRLKNVGNVVSMGNLSSGEAAKKTADLDKAFNLGELLAIQNG
jgi:multimeric flavodoxin WrbA